MLINEDTIKTKKLIETRLFHCLKEENEVFEVDPRDLLTPNRFDVAIKLSYLRNNGIAPDFSREMYADHILAFGGGRFHEPEKSEKNSLEVFLEEFAAVARDIKDSGFDGNRSIIPLARDGSILNGSHRVAAAIFYGRTVKAMKLDVDPSMYDYAFFAKRHTPWSTLAAGLQEYMLQRPDMRVAIYWPKTSHLINYRPKQVVAECGDNLSLKELAGFVRQVYRTEPWLGDPGNKYRGAFHKAQNCYKEDSLLKVIAFLPEPNEDLSVVKDRIRQELNVGKHCLHISDHVQDTWQVINFFFNKNSRWFLSAEDIGRFPEKDKKVRHVFDSLESIGASHYATAVDAGCVLEIFGLRQANDIDTISIDDESNVAALKQFGIQNHNQEFAEYSLDFREVVCNPRMHFWYNGVKIVSLDVLKRFKEERGEVKDKNDLSLIKSLISQSFWSVKVARLKQQMFYLKYNLVRRLRGFLVSILKKVGLFNYLKSMLGK